MQWRLIRREDIALICGLLAENPAWGRKRLSIELCQRWEWRNSVGRLKDMACRTLLLKLEKGGAIRLPPRRAGWSKPPRRRPLAEVFHDRSPIEESLSSLQPIGMETLATGHEQLPLFRYLLQSLRVPVKDIYLYPLRPDFRERLCRALAFQPEGGVHAS